jgi:hypothetical protein
MEFYHASNSPEALRRIILQGRSVIDCRDRRTYRMTLSAATSFTITATISLVIGTRSPATTPPGLSANARLDVFARRPAARVGVESTVSYGAGLMRFMQQAGIADLEVTTPDGQDRRRRGKNDDLDAQNAAHAAFAGERTVTPRSRDGMMESLRVLMACRKTAVTARRVANSSARWPRGGPA